MTSLTLKVGLPCGCVYSFEVNSAAGVESLHFFFKHAAEVLMHRADECANDHKCEGGHAD